MNNLDRNNQKTSEEKLKEIKLDFIKKIPQLKDIQEVQKIYREVQESRREDKFPYINTQTSSTV